MLRIHIVIACKSVRSFVEIFQSRSKNNRYIFFIWAYTSRAVPITNGVIIKVLEKELADANRIAHKTHKKVESFRKTLVAESERLQARAKRELNVTRKKIGSANARLTKAGAALKAGTQSDNKQKVEVLKKQVQELTQAIADFSKAAFEAAEKYVTVKGDTTMVAKKKAAPKKKAVAKKAPAKKKAVAKKKAPAKKKAVAKKRLRPRRRQ